MADIFGKYVGYTGQEEEALARLGGTIADIGSMFLGEVIQKKETEEYTNALSSWLDEKSDYTKWQRENATNPENYVAELERRKEQMQANILSGVSTPGAKRRVVEKFNDDFNSLKESAAKTASNQAQANMSMAFGINYGKVTEPPAPEDIIDEDYVKDKLTALSELLDENEGKIPELMIPEQIEEFQEQALKRIISPFIISRAASEEDIDKANSIAKEFGFDKLYNIDEVAELKKDYESKIKQEDYNAAQKLVIATNEFYNESVPKLNSNTLTADDIEMSKLSKEDKDNWKEFLKGSFKTPQTKSIASSYEQVIKTVLAYSQKSISKKEAIDRLMKERYGNNLVSDEDYQWALEKLNNPYPKHLVSRIENMLKATEEQTRSVWDVESTEKKKATELNRNILQREITEDLFSWIDSQEKEPTAKDIYKHLMESVLTKKKIVKKTPSYEINQIIDRGGRKWKIVDFDTDGEPLVEEVQ